MRYKNTKTGAIVDSPFKVSGKYWEEVGKTKEENPTKKTEYVEEEINLEEMTNKELEELAKKEGIELTREDKKNKEKRITAIVKAFE